MYDLDIMIPTYNRVKYLKKNIEMLLDYIERLGVGGRVRIVVSDNCSTDGTAVYLKEVEQRTSEVVVYRQTENIGVKRNSEFVFNKSIATYSMYLGDDDYLSFEYLRGVLLKIQDEAVSLIIPSFYPVDESGNRIGVAGRGINRSSAEFHKGRGAVAKLAHLAHQLSGVVYKRAGLYEQYKADNVDSIYLYIYFACQSAMNGKSWYFTEYPVQVTQPPQSKKDWDYGKDGLLEEKFKCYYYSFKNDLFFRLILELQQLLRQSGSVLKYMRGGVGSYLGVFAKLIGSRYVSFYTKLTLPFLIFLFPVVNFLNIAKYMGKKIS